METRNSNVVQIRKDDEDPVDWIVLSARILAFRKQYPVEQGWAIEVTRTDPGVPMKDSSGVSYPTVEFRARFKDKDGRLLEEASSLCPIIGNDSWEIGESRARARLLAALGYGGRLLDYDEATLQARMGFALDGGTSKPASAASSDTSGAAAKPASEKESSAQATANDRKVESHPRASPGATAKRSQGNVSTLPKAAPTPALLKTIESKARVLKVTVPVLATQEEAQAFFKQLLVKGGG